MSTLSSTLSSNLSELTKMHTQKCRDRDELIVRIACLTDEQLLEQLREEFVMYEEEIADLAQKIEAESAKHVEEMAKNVLDEWESFYSAQYVDATLMDIFAKYQLTEVFSKLRMRPIYSLTQRRELCLFLNEIKRQIVLCDYENISFETIGKYPDAAPIVINCRGFSKIGKITDKICVHC